MITLILIIALGVVLMVRDSLVLPANLLTIILWVVASGFFILGIACAIFGTILRWWMDSPLLSDTEKATLIEKRRWGKALLIASVILFALGTLVLLGLLVDLSFNMGWIWSNVLALPWYWTLALITAAILIISFFLYYYYWWRRRTVVTVSAAGATPAIPTPAVATTVATTETVIAPVVVRRRWGVIPFLFRFIFKLALLAGLIFLIWWWWGLYGGRTRDSVVSATRGFFHDIQTYRRQLAASPGSTNLVTNRIWIMTWDSLPGNVPHPWDTFTREPRAVIVAQHDEFYFNFSASFTNRRRKGAEFKFTWDKMMYPNGFVYHLPSGCRGMWVLVPKGEIFSGWVVEEFTCNKYIITLRPEVRY